VAHRADWRPCPPAYPPILIEFPELRVRALGRLKQCDGVAVRVFDPR
jgi:hypothetical protein